ncbi:hypothetical protein B0T17DRAFT_518552 [Bombardia bombarda]|uniref:Uncharacterized protein n=1 Tax=Bombardia bombarda TaxID=252184 RepID=A0AA39XLI8_9PEZI|nr:hypothetical protein B0T17DRAFT_518552 [Bombardia bombarda]
MSRTAPRHHMMAHRQPPTTARYSPLSMPLPGYPREWILSIALAHAQELDWKQ